MVLVQGIEPQTDAYKATVIPFNYTSEPSYLLTLLLALNCRGL
jgi:hypothetical protein